VSIGSGRALVGGLRVLGCSFKTVREIQVRELWDLLTFVGMKTTLNVQLAKLQVVNSIGKERFFQVVHTLPNMSS